MSTIDYENGDMADIWRDFGSDGNRTTTAVIAITSMGMGVHFFEMLVALLSFSLHSGWCLFCLYEWKDGAKHKRAMFLHVLLLSIITGSVYKIITGAVIVYRKTTSFAGAELICFMFVEVCIYDVGFAILIQIYLNVLAPTITTTKGQRAVRVLRVVVVVIPVVSMVNSVYTSLVVSLSPKPNILGPLMYSVSIPVMAINKTLLLVIAIALSVVLIRMLHSGSDKILQMPVIKIAVALLFFVVSNLVIFVCTAMSYLYGIIVVAAMYYIPSIMLYGIIVAIFFPFHKLFAIFKRKQQPDL
jgi:hypothetical protein